VAAGALVALGTAVPVQAAVVPGEGDFSVGGYTFTKNAKVGDTQALRFGFTNTGKNAADGVLLVLRTGPGLAYQEKFSNCEYLETDAGYFARNAICSFKGAFAPGASYRLTQPLTLKTLPSAWTDMYFVDAYPDTPAIREMLRDGKTYTPGSGPAAAVEPVASLEPSRSVDEDAVYTHDNKADFAVTGASAEGAPGSTVALTPGWSNNGPATITEPWDATRIATVEVKLPKGVTMAESPCEERTEKNPEGGGEKGVVWYACGPNGWQVPAGAKGSVPLKLKIDAGAAPGELVGEVKWSERPILHNVGIGRFDNTPANNSARITIKVTGSGTVTPGPSVTPSARPTPTATGATPSATATPSSSGSTSAGPDPRASAKGGQGGGPLASTGTTALTVGGVGAVLVGLGAGLWAVARKRRAA
jgi:hypothetical protein